MNHSKIILLACISGFVAITTAWLGVAGTIVGSVVSSLLYNTLSEILEKPVTERKFSFNFEYEIAYVFPLVVIAFIQLSLLAAFLAQWGYLPGTFLNAYLKIQGAVDNNLYRILGFALVVMGIYPFIIKPNIVKKSYGIIVAFIGLIFLARGFVDSNLSLTNLYSGIFQHFDFYIEIFAFFLIVIVILLILNNASQVHRDFKLSKESGDDSKIVKVSKRNRAKLSYDDLEDLELKEVKRDNINHQDNYEDIYIYSQKDNSPDAAIIYSRKWPRKEHNVQNEVNNKKNWPNKSLMDNTPDINYRKDHFPAPKRNPLNRQNQRNNSRDSNQRKR